VPPQRSLDVYLRGVSLIKDICYVTVREPALCELPRSRYTRTPVLKPLDTDGRGRYLHRPRQGP